MTETQPPIETIRQECPNAGEEYVPTDFFGRESGQVTDHHAVSRKVYVEIRGDEIVLVGEGSCPCGWSDKVEVSGDE